MSDISLSPSTVSDRNWLNAGGNLGMGFELKSATWRARRAPMLSGMSGISETNGIIKMTDVILN